MNVLFLVLNKTEFLDEILDAFVDVGVKGATILDSQGMGSALASNERNTPFFGALMSLMDNTRPFNKTIFTVIEDKEILEKAVQAVKEILGDMKDPGCGLMFTLPLDNVYGFRD